MREYQYNAFMYYIAALIAEPLAAQVLEMKLAIQKQFGFTHALRSPAHLTLIPPFFFDRREELREAVRAVRVPAFTLNVTGFGHFQKRVIFLDVKTTLPLIGLYHLAMETVRKLHIPVKEINRPFHPHVTLAHRDCRADACDRVLSCVQGMPFAKRVPMERAVLFTKEPRDPAWRLLRS